MAPSLPEDLPWVEKYRPNKIKDLVYQQEAAQLLHSCLTCGNLPHCLFYGPPGTGKTSAALAFCKELFPPEIYRDRVLELNASDERGIKVVREKIKRFAQGSVSSAKFEGYLCPPFKIIILDEADAITPDAQTALRRTMEQFSRITRFFLLCNYVTRVIDPLASRCAKFRFRPLPIELQMDRLKYIVGQEGISISEELLRRLTRACNGDLRRAIMALESAHRLSRGNNITEEDIDSVSWRVPDEIIARIDSTCRKISSLGENTLHFSELRNMAMDFINNGYPVSEIMYQLCDALISASHLNKLQKSVIMIRFARAEKMLVDGSDELLVLLDIFGVLFQVYNEPENVEKLISLTRN
ncbi:hypothetical protein GAYE_SCF05G2588 [Galdieria yellowstonensis]|uniref:AAA+ ATPase domain-containing protein n=1 Tax=Galdieria yellowstonensis TaxID=3028027 RepID=A0AAV9IB66_9RHOD|nr:hypothetical protein GAYE_SCF05G2588 [Galdieria yellowstonensis]